MNRFPDLELKDNEEPQVRVTRLSFQALLDILTNPDPEENKPSFTEEQINFIYKTAVAVVEMHVLATIVLNVMKRVVDPRDGGTEA